MIDIRTLHVFENLSTNTHYMLAVDWYKCCKHFIQLLWTNGDIR